MMENLTCFLVSASLAALQPSWAFLATLTIFGLFPIGCARPCAGSALLTLFEILALSDEYSIARDRGEEVVGAQDAVLGAVVD